MPNREGVVELLRRVRGEERVASASAARTRSELERLTADVSVEPLHDVASASAEPVGGGVRVREGQSGTRWVVSIMGGHDKRGRWPVAPRATVLNIMGGSDIDLNDADLSGPVTELNVYSLMGGGEVRVPHGVDVRVSNFALMGGNDVKLGEEVAPPGAPTIHIRLVSIMGGSEVARGRKSTREATGITETQLNEAVNALDIVEMVETLFEKAIEKLDRRKIGRFTVRRGRSTSSGYLRLTPASAWVDRWSGRLFLGYDAGEATRQPSDRQLTFWLTVGLSRAHARLLSERAGFRRQLDQRQLDFDLEKECFVGSSIPLRQLVVADGSDTLDDQAERLAAWAQERLAVLLELKPGRRPVSRS